MDVLTALSLSLRRRALTGRTSTGLLANLGIPLLPSGTKQEPQPRRTNGYKVWLPQGSGDVDDDQAEK